MKFLVNYACSSLAHPQTLHRAELKPDHLRSESETIASTTMHTNLAPPPRERAPKRRGCVGAVNRDHFCRGLIDRMLSPGFWARFAGPFKQPVDPDLEGIPDYFEVIKCLMDLSIIKTKCIIKTKMDGNEYANAKEFEADIR
jgi:hypothetical protein